MVQDRHIAIRARASPCKDLILARLELNKIGRVEKCATQSDIGVDAGGELGTATLSLELVNEGVPGALEVSEVRSLGRELAVLRLRGARSLRRGSGCGRLGCGRLTASTRRMTATSTTGAATAVARAIRARILLIAVDEVVREMFGEKGSVAGDVFRSLCD